MDAVSPPEGIITIKSLPGGMFLYSIQNAVGNIVSQNVASLEEIKRLTGYNKGRINLMINK
jgi:hypothetical protein